MATITQGFKTERQKINLKPIKELSMSYKIKIVRDKSTKDGYCILVNNKQWYFDKLWKLTKEQTNLLQELISEAFESGEAKAKADIQKAIGIDEFISVL